MGIGRLFEQYGAFEVAAGVYGDFAKFAAGVKPLAQSASSAPSTAETASGMAAAALDSRAAKALAKTMADRKPDEPPPAKLSDEFAAAIAAHKAFLAAYPNSILSSDALRKITGVAVEYAKIDAWEVAEGVYADLAKSELKIRRPERLEFARGMCQLGRAMPAHAREILIALNAAGLGEEEKNESAPTALADEPAEPAVRPFGWPMAAVEGRCGGMYPSGTAGQLAESSAVRAAQALILTMEPISVISVIGLRYPSSSPPPPHRARMSGKRRPRPASRPLLQQ